MLAAIVRKFKRRSDGDKHYYRIIKDIFGFRPGNIELYKLALIHRSTSYATVEGKPVNNERLEFLGDAVLDTVVSDYLFIEYPYGDEGFLTQLRSKIVNRATLNELCVRIGLSEHIISQPGSYTQKHLYGDALEAMIGAVYLDKGYNFVNRLLINHVFADYLDLDFMTETETDYKSRLIEWCQKNRHSIKFDTRQAEESVLQNPKFRSVAIIEGMEMGYGFGATKKEAEQHAAFSVSQYTNMTMEDDLLDMVDRATLDEGEKRGPGRSAPDGRKAGAERSRAAKKGPVRRKRAQGEPAKVSQQSEAADTAKADSERPGPGRVQEGAANTRDDD